VSQRALVLGAGGFLGSHLARWLVRDGWEVTGVALDPHVPHVATRLGATANDMRLVAGSAWDPDLLARELRGVDAVFPFASLSGAARSMEEPLDDLAANAGAQLTLLEVLRRHNPEARVVFPGSRLQYGIPRRLPVGESHPMEPVSVYGVHKLVAEHYHRLYHRVHGIPTCCLRISNPYGPWQDRPDRAFGVVGTFLAMAARGKEIPLYGGGGQLRDYVYVEDLAELMILAATDPAAVGMSFNAGGAEPISLRGMASAVIEIVGRGRLVDAPWPEMDAAVETGDYYTDLRSVRDVLGWEPTTELPEGLASTWAALAPELAQAV